MTKEAKKATTEQKKNPDEELVASMDNVSKRLISGMEKVQKLHPGWGEAHQQLQNQSIIDLFNGARVQRQEQDVKIILEGQYERAVEMLMDADVAGLYPVLVGPPGVGKTAICRYYAQIRSEMSKNQSFEWLTFDEATKPTHLVGSFNPALAINKGFTPESFNFGPLARAMLTGGIFLANEINRATEYTQNSLLEPLEEKMLNIPHLGRFKSNPGFFFIGAMNPSEIAGTHRLGDALKDRLKVWITLTYPSKQTEKEIIRVNNPYFSLTEDALQKTYELIKATRDSSDIEIPASLRAGISIARLTGIATQKYPKKDIDSLLSKNAYYVLTGSIKPKPGVKPETIISEIIRDRLGISPQSVL